MIDRIYLTYADSNLYVATKILADRTGRSWESFGLDPTDFWPTILRNYGKTGGQFVLDRKYIEAHIDTEDLEIAQILWAFSSMYDNGLTSADKTFLKLKWNFK